MTTLTLSIEKCGSHSANFDTVCSSLAIRTARIAEFSSPFLGNAANFGIALSTSKHPLLHNLYLPGVYAAELNLLRPLARHDLAYPHSWEQKPERFWSVNWPATRTVEPFDSSVYLAPEFLHPSGSHFVEWPVWIGAYSGMSHDQAQALRMHPEDLLAEDFEGLAQLQRLASHPEKSSILRHAVSVTTSIQNFCRFFCSRYPERGGYVQWPFFSIIEPLYRQENEKTKAELMQVAGIFLSSLREMFTHMVVVGEGADYTSRENNPSMTYIWSDIDGFVNDNIEGWQDASEQIATLNNLAKPTDPQEYTPVLPDETLPKPLLVQSWVTKAELLRLEGRFTDALASYLRAHKLDPNNQAIAIKAMQQSLELNDVDTASQVNESLKTNNPNIHYQLLLRFLALLKDPGEPFEMINTVTVGSTIQMQLAALISRSPAREISAQFYKEIHSLFTDTYAHAIALSTLRHFKGLKERFARLIEMMPASQSTNKIRDQLMSEALARGDLAELTRFNKR
ncbi:tetratricopeptide repeat protein [Alteromonas sp. ASW11-130]|uniref:tetratricopeptide repeat protein n=1 Tax=Alteromonas sp. ASW11-130 TaxID=3015775 RepID=UPI002241F1D7|nr:tetratricopeptide repeat protein [Alteromonas sp. ASW11-130]MCW8090710.1 tetratricopeptide repeat protein [Alteromonas sp. ASW11-130]